MHVWLFHFKITDALRRSERRREQSERRGGSWGWGVPLAGPRGAHLPVRRQVASDERSGPRATGDQVLLDASLEYTEFAAAGVARPARGVRAASPQGEHPTPMAPHAARAPQRSERSPPHVRHRRPSLPARLTPARGLSAAPPAP